MCLSCIPRRRRSSHPAPTDRARQRSNERGATIVEYSLLLALVLGSIYATVDSLQGGAGDYLAANADTVGRPRSLTVPTTAPLGSTLSTTTTDGATTTMGPFATDDFAAATSSTTAPPECKGNAGNANANAAANANGNSQVAACAGSSAAAAAATTTTTPTPTTPTSRTTGKPRRR
ncbi:MAG: Flp family type IVb pilin [Acidimicrobiales bacterium]